MKGNITFTECGTYEGLSKFINVKDDVELYQLFLSENIIEEVNL